MRRQWLSAACFVVLVTTAATQPRPRHAVVLLIDDLGYGDTGHMGAEFATPAIDALALDGIRLNQSCEPPAAAPRLTGLLVRVPPPPLRSVCSFAWTLDGLCCGKTHPSERSDPLPSDVMQLCSPTRSSLVTSRYPYNIGMDGNVLVGGDARCVPTNVSTVGDQMSANGVATAFIGKVSPPYTVPPPHVWIRLGHALIACFP